MSMPTPGGTRVTIEPAAFGSVVLSRGNRCWWQAGLLECLRRSRIEFPRPIVGTSTGAAVGAAFLGRSVESALQACKAPYARKQKQCR